MKRELLRQVRTIDPVLSCDRAKDVLLVDGCIAAIQDRIADFPCDTQVIPAEKLILAPGLVDLYSYSGEPGHEDRETLESLSKSAIAGGFTQVALLPDTLPPLDNATAIAGIQQHLKPQSPVKLQFWGAISQNLQGERMAELEELMRSGIIGFADGRAISNLGLLRRVLEYLKPSGIPLALFSLNPSLRERGVMREGQASIRYGLPGDPLYSESIAVAASIELVASVGTPIHLMRISTRRSLELIADARQRGLPITASTTWLHLLFDTEAIASYDPNLRLDPPLGNPDDRLALIEGVKSGTIGAIAIDHTPYSYEEKTLAFAEAPAGAIGLQLALPILWDKFARSEKWTALQLWQAMSLKPRHYLNQSPMALSAENNRDFILFDADRVWTVNSESIESLSQNTVYWGKTLRGKVLRVGVWELAELTKRSQ